MSKWFYDHDNLSGKYKFEIVEKLPPGEEILKRCSNFSAIIDQAHTEGCRYITAYYSFRIHTLGYNCKI